MAGSWAPEVHANLDRYEVYIAYNDQQDIVWLEEQPKGDVQLLKVPAQADLTEGNSCYSLEGAVYGVYQDAGCTVQAGETGDRGRREDGQSLRESRHILCKRRDAVSRLPPWMGPCTGWR